MGEKALKIDPLERAVAGLLSEAAEAAGWSPARLAREAGLNRARVYTLLASESPMTMTTLDAMCAALGLRASDVVREAEAAVARERSWGLAASRHEGADVERRTRAGLPAVDPEDESQADPFEED